MRAKGRCPSSPAAHSPRDIWKKKKGKGAAFGFFLIQILKFRARHELIAQVAKT